MGPRVTCGDSDLAQRYLRMARYTDCARKSDDGLSGESRLFTGD